MRCLMIPQAIPQPPDRRRRKVWRKKEKNTDGAGPAADPAAAAKEGGDDADASSLFLTAGGYNALDVSVSRPPPAAAAEEKANGEALPSRLLRCQVFHSNLNPYSPSQTLMTAATT